MGALEAMIMFQKVPYVVLLMSVIVSGCAASIGVNETELIPSEQSAQSEPQTVHETHTPFDSAQSTQIVLTPTMELVQSISVTASPTPATDEAQGSNRKRVGNSKTNRIINFLLRGDYQYLGSFLHFSSLPCTNVYGQSRFPACSGDEVEGTVVEVFPISSSEMTFVRHSEIDNWLGFEIDHLASIYGDYRESDQPEYWNQFYYVMMFVLKDSRLLMVRTTEDYIIRMDFVPLPWTSSLEVIPYIGLMEFPKPNGLFSPENYDHDEMKYGIVEGKLCFPGQRIPSMTLYFQEVGADSATSLEIGSNQLYYVTRLVPGTYHAYEWSDGSGALYSEYVLCDYEKGEKCDNHALVEFEILPGKTTYGIDICDWYAPQDEIPRPPGE